MLTTVDIVNKVTHTAECDILELTGRHVKVVVIGLDPKSESEIPGLTPMELIKVAAHALGLHPDMARLKTREVKIVAFRQICMKLLRKHFASLTLKDIARLMVEGFDHSTVLHHLKSFNGRLKSDMEFNMMYNQVLVALAKWERKV